MEDTTLWRYYDLVKFFSLIKGDFHFARADKFKDRYEGAIPRKNFQDHVEWMGYGSNDLEKDSVKKEFEQKFEERKRKAAISCWHINKSESAAMWDIYSRAGHGIAVRTSVNKLKAIPKPDTYELVNFEVNYIDFDKEYKPEYNNFELLPFINKRLEFEHEHEYRLMLYQDNFDSQPFKDIKLDYKNPLKASEIVKYGFVSKLNDMPEEGLIIKVDSSSLIDEIIASPYMKSFEVNVIQNILDMFNKENGTSFIIKRSNLYEGVVY